MDNFEFFNSTRILFGHGQIAALAQQVPADAKVLIVSKSYPQISE